MTTSHDKNFFDDIDGALTPEQAAQALRLAETGDTGGKPDNGGAPTTTPANDETSTSTQSTAATGEGVKPIPEDQMTAENTVILARDGKHTIEFSHLDKARTQRDEFKAQAEAAQRELVELRAQAQARADAGQAATKTDNMVATAEAAIAAGADASLFGDFSEEALKAGITKLVDQRVEAGVQKALAPLQAKEQVKAADAHLDAIYKAHPNADSIAQSAEFTAWVDAHPSVVRNALWGLFDTKTGGTAEQIVETFDAFVKAGAKEVQQQPAATSAAAKAAAAAVKQDPPSSLTGIPGGRVDGLSPDERMADITGGVELMYAMEGKTPEQITAWLNKQM
ncbi:MAG: hypothetical protein RR326_14540 [Stenotrophomonas sp.]